MHSRNLLILPACLLALGLFATPALTQSKLQTSPGGYHGELDFPISWKRYYSYEEWTQIMRDMQEQYSHLADIQSIGQSRMGRDQYLITITAKNTGDHSEKPAMYVDGAIHGNEVNGVMCSLYLMWYLLTRYDYDPYVYDLVNTTTFYILPGLNVDAIASFVSFFGSKTPRLNAEVHSLVWSQAPKPLLVMNAGSSGTWSMRCTMRITGTKAELSVIAF